MTNPGARSRFRAFAPKGFTALLNWMFWLNFGYYNGAVLQRNDLLRSIEIRTDSFAYQAEAVIKLIARGATYRLLHPHPRPGGRALVGVAPEKPARGLENHPSSACGRRAVSPASARANAAATQSVIGISRRRRRRSIRLQEPHPC